MALDVETIRLLKSAYLELGQVFQVDTDRVAAKHYARAELIIQAARDNQSAPEKADIIQALNDYFGTVNITATYMGYQAAQAMEYLEETLSVDVDYVPSPLRGGDLRPSV